MTSKKSSKPNSTMIWFLGAIAFLVVMSFFGGNSSTPEPKSEVDTEQAEGAVLSSSGNNLVYDVVEVIDGDTIKIDIEGEERRIRLLGIDTPETSSSPSGAECFGEEAKEYLTQLLDGEKIYLKFDGSQDRVDRYDRYLNYIWIDDGDEDDENDLLVNRHLIAAGYAYEYTYDVPYFYQSEFKEAQSTAKLQNRGLWAPGICETSTPETE